MNQKQTAPITIASITNRFPSDLTTIEQPLVHYSSTFVKGLPQKKEGASICAFISIGREHCSGEQLTSLVKLLNHTFTKSHVTFILADRLQRFTNQLYGMPAEEAEKKGIQDGLAWKAAHKSILESELTHLTYDFVHWSELTNLAENHKAYEEKIQEAYQTDRNFKRKFNKTATDFLSAQLGDPNIQYVADNEEGNKLCLAYLKEEAAVQVALANRNENKFDYAVYPRNLSDALSITYQTFIPDNALVYLTVKNKPLKPEPILLDNVNKKPAESKKLIDSTRSASQSVPSSLSFFTKENGRPPRGSPSSSSSSESSPNGSPPQDSCLSLLYIKSLKLIVDSAGIPSHEKIELLRKMLEQAEQMFSSQGTKFTPHAN